ncbi:MAG TPA: hypothetical protein VFO67_04755 [Gemmatimonadales bacterium]|nr:hypothetical protein [Gemmatimonadales bacterium]
MLKVRELYQVEFADGVKGALGIDERGRLYWNGEAVVTDQRVLLPWWVSFAVVACGLSTLVIAMLAVLTYFTLIQAVAV